MKEKEFLKSLEEASNAFKHASTLLDNLLGNFSEEQLEGECSLPFVESDYGMVLSEYVTYFGDSSYTKEEIIRAMKIDDLLED